MRQSKGVSRVSRVRWVEKLEFKFRLCDVAWPKRETGAAPPPLLEVSGRAPKEAVLDRAAPLPSAKGVPDGVLCLLRGVVEALCDPEHLAQQAL